MKDEHHLASATEFLDSYCDDHEMLKDTENLFPLWESSPSSYQGINGDVAIDETSTTSLSSMSEESDDVQAKRDARSAQAAVRRRRYRQRQKSEREMLRTNCYELSMQLDQLRAAIKEKKEKEAAILGFSAWKAAAILQKEKRNEAEQTHRKLRSLVSNRFRLISEMNALLKDRFSRPPHLGVLEKSSFCAGHTLTEVYLPELDSYYARTDQIIHDVPFTLAPTLTYNLTKTRGQNVDVFSAASMACLPLKYANTCRALSSMLLVPSGSNFINVRLEAENTAAMSYQQKFQKDLDTSKLITHLVVRRYVSGNRTVFVWRSFLEGIEELRGYQTDETAWLVVSPSVDASKSVRRENSVARTVLQLYIRLVPVRFGEENCTTNSDRFMNAVVDMCKAELEVTMQHLEISANDVQTLWKHS